MTPRLVSSTFVFVLACGGTSSQRAESDPEVCTTDSSGGDTPQSGCIAEPFQHGVGILIERYGSEIEERIGRAPTPADYPTPGESCFHQHELPDLDGDSDGEIELTEECTFGMHAWLHLVYLSNRGCTRFAGVILNGELERTGATHEGVSDLESTSSDGCAGADFHWSRYAIEEGQYREVESASCQLCPDNGPPPADANTHRICQERAAEM